MSFGLPDFWPEAITLPANETSHAVESSIPYHLASSTPSIHRSTVYGESLRLNALPTSSSSGFVCPLSPRAFSISRRPSRRCHSGLVPVSVLSASTAR